ncbi:MAG: hypothetical protein WC372_05920 [Candidatus Neomarinimicrobiota bacterium]|jgi:hypothetical protein|nr:hypothetical protein [Candidatus Neomarinimicrobiota bacterium]MDD3966160.1 hypothetical protein [Candidatus Neomarinimicrobiota bacterium]MDX9779734.1 hypothetical protein [bacterium]
MKFVKFLIVFPFFTALLQGADTLYYDISLLGIKVAGVEIIDSLRRDASREIMYRAFTVGAFDKVYDTENRYYFYTDSAMTQMDSLRKIIHEHDLEQVYTEQVRNGMIHYSNASPMESILPLHHVLSFLIYLQYHPEKRVTGAPFNFLLSDEGELYHPEVRVAYNAAKDQDEVYFTLYKVAGVEVLEPTDVFNWMICAGSGERMMAYSRKDNKISEGFFALGWGLHLRAKRVYK